MGLDVLCCQNCGGFTPTKPYIYKGYQFCSEGCKNEFYEKGLDKEILSLKDVLEYLRKR